MRVFRSRAWAHIPSKKRWDLDPQSQECLFVGYHGWVKCYRLLIPNTKKIFIEIHVIFEQILIYETCSLTNAQIVIQNEFYDSSFNVSIEI